MEESGQSTNKQIRTLIRKIASTFGVEIVDIMYATVQAGSVDLSARTCTVVPITGKSDTPLQGVKLQADPSDGELKAPSDGSTVVVGVSTSLDAFIFMYSDLDSISWKGGNLAGLVKVIDLTTKLNNLEKLVNDFVLKYNSHVHLGVTVGAGITGITQPASLETTILIPTLQSDIENPKMLHGNK
jgi:hypothetical protein